MGSSSLIKRNIAFVFAHPDDEAMFFAPTLTSLMEDNDIYFLCFSTGDYEGLGETRKRELLKSASLFKVKEVEIIDHPNLRDGMKEKWDVKLISKIVSDFAHKYSINKIITFDESGVSSHPNHIAVYNGVKDVIKHNKDLLGYKLLTTNIVRKYIAFFDLPLSYFLLNPNDELYYSATPLASLRAMQAHYSQFVWFRKLFVLFSRYGFINTLSPI